jgi:uncharacterized phage-like protein YoqJ
MHIFCFTGHRPNKLGGYNWNTLINKKIMVALKKEIINNMKYQYDNFNEYEFTFICGGALGIDQMAFEIIYEIKQNLLKSNKLNLKIHLILAMPFEKQSDNWYDLKDKERLQSQMERADQVILVDTLEKYRFQKVAIGEYHPVKMQLRNQYMVDNSDTIIGVWDGTQGGTGNCINYARKSKKQIIIINPSNII